MGSSQEAQPNTAGQQKVFEPRDLSQRRPIFSLPGEIWTSIVETPCSFEPEYYQHVMLNLIRHPEISSTYLFRAEIFYDSFNDPEGKFVKHIKREYKPINCVVPGYDLQQTIVRRMIPRNPQRDNPLVQTCHVFNSKEQPCGAEKSLVIYIPHVESADVVPFYHPTVSALAFLHIWPTTTSTPDSPAPLGTLSIHYRLFPTHPLDNRLTRTALSLLTLITKHSNGQKAGYTKRVHHDQIIPQARFQDTYTRLKTTYAKRLIDAWVEQTPPGKHVFEDLGIAAFLIELWRDMYAPPPSTTTEPPPANPTTTTTTTTTTKPPFPGFVDIGCGNGILVHVLRSEGYPGWGFDARRRKTWDTFAPAVRASLHELVLVPAPFAQAAAAAAAARRDAGRRERTHDGVFAPGTFVVSNHADELTPWTPLLAFLSRAPFVAIPCCSHDLAGARFRAPVRKGGREGEGEGDGGKGGGEGGKTGTLRKKGPAQPSAYATLCDWVARLAADVGFVVEKEMLRIPSTRNAGIIGREGTAIRGGSGGDGVGEGADRLQHGGGDERLEERLEVVRRLLAEEMGGNVDGVGGLEVMGRDWVERAGKLVKGMGGGH